MRQQELASLVEGLKTEFSKAPRLNRRSISDRATGANLAALDLLLDSAKAVEAAPGKTEQARTLKALSNEFTEISDVIRTLGPR